jgi:uncharacterized protein (TIGR02646 family)
LRAIVKGQEPRSLTEHRRAAHCSYDNYPAKDELRRALVREQRGLCCYCMGRIGADATAMKVEHWKSQSRFRSEQLSYRNLLGACVGGHGQPPNLQHCDTCKGDRDIQWNPAEPTHYIENRVNYEPDGVISSDDPVFDEQINNVLNLNLPRIKNSRKSVLTAVIEWWKTEVRRLRGPVPRERLQKEVRKRTEGTGTLEPYCQVVVYWLNRKLERMT